MRRLFARLKSPLFLALLAAALPAQISLRSGVHPEDMDTSCQPCTDFWRYVNGGWLDRNPIPARASSWGTFSVLRDSNRERMKTILDAASANAKAPATSNERKMGDFYSSCMATSAIEARGLAPIQPDFAKIAALKSTGDLAPLLATYQRMAIPNHSPNASIVVGPFRIISSTDPKDSTRVIARIVERDGAGGNSSIFSLPDRDYFFKNDAKSQQIRDEFLKYVSRTLTLAGEKPEEAEAHAHTVLMFETSIAESVLNNADRRDPDKTYHPIDLAGLKQLAPNLDWTTLLHDVGIPEGTAINVAEPELLKKVNQQLTDVPLDDWKTWLKWRVLKVSAPYLPAAIAQEEFHFTSTVLSGITEQQPRWQTCSEVVDRDFSDALGQAYVAKYFPPEAKRRMAELVENLRAAMKDEIENSEWMQTETKINALRKLEALKVKIGYPDRWRDYSDLKFDRSNYFENIRAAWQHNQKYQYSKIGKPANRADWNMTPPTVNAYSSAGQVEVVFPAGILQAPFFDLTSDDAANYGAIGAVIGHEIDHQFDDSGSKYDAQGALKNWWTGDDRKKFDTRTSCVVNQFNSIDVGNGLRHNGRLVLGEALGDLGGIQTAYNAYHRSLKGKFQPEVMDGFTGDQRFFIAYAKVWGSQARPEADRLQVNTNPHPIAKFRANATLQNMPEFHKAFNCKRGDQMVRPQESQCRLW
jgi:predicted metalloendopeptidase